jgi:hypothetical protein
LLLPPKIIIFVKIFGFCFVTHVYVGLVEERYIKRKIQDPFRRLPYFTTNRFTDEF